MLLGQPRQAAGTRPTGALLCVLLLAAIVPGCAEKKAVVVVPPSAPAPPKPKPVKRERPLHHVPPPPPSVKEEPPLPPMLLSPDATEGEADRLKQEAKTRVEGAEQLVKQIDQKRLAKGQQETFLTIQSFLSKAKEALAIEDFLRASNLADKAQVLAREMLHTIR